MRILPNTLKKALVKNSDRMIVNTLLITRTNGLTICEYSKDDQISTDQNSKTHRRKKKQFSIQSYPQKYQFKKSLLELFEMNTSPDSQQQKDQITLQEIIKSTVIEHSRKLTINTYDNQVLHLQIKDFTIYYRAYAALLFIVATQAQYPMTLVLNLFEKIKQIYDQQVRNIFHSDVEPSIYVDLTLPSKLTLSQEHHLKCISTKFAAMLRQNEEKNTQKFSAMNNNLQKHFTQITEQQKSLIEKQQKMNSYKTINSYNDQAQDYHYQLNSILIVMHAKKALAFVAYAITIIIWLYFLFY